MAVQFQKQVGTSATEGTNFVITLTPVAALTEALTVRWELVFSGDMPAWSGHFTSTTGTLTFANRATATQTFTLPIADNTRADLLDRTFALRLIQVNADGREERIGDDTTITLTDDDRGSYTPRSRFISGDPDNDVYVYGTNETVTATGLGGNDVFVIHRFHSGALTIDDTGGQNVIQLDYGTTITHVNEIAAFIRGVGKLVNSVTLTLSEGGTVEIRAPAQSSGSGNRYSFQIGDGKVTDYAAFYNTLVAGGLNRTTKQLTTPFVVGSLISEAPDLSGNTLTPKSRFITGGSDNDVYVYGTNETVTATGLGGNDVFVIHRFHSGALGINDTGGQNLIKFDYGTTITHVNEIASFIRSFGKIVSSVTLTLSEGGTVEITAPAQPSGSGNRYSFQIGDGEVTDYTAFYNTLIAGGINRTTKKLTTDFVVPLGNTPDPRLIDGGDGKDVYVFGTNETVEATGGAGNDVFVIHRLHTGALTIHDTAGQNLIQLDYGTTITHVHEDTTTTRHLGKTVNSVTLTLSEGGTVKIPQPASLFGGGNRYFFQIGDGKATNYMAFYNTLVAGGLNGATKQLTTPFTVGSLIPEAPDLSGNTGASKNRYIDGGDGRDVYVYGTNETVAATGLAGDDVFVIHRFHTGALTIHDTGGQNRIQFDYGTSITHVDEDRTDIQGFGKLIDSVTLTLSEGGTVTIPRAADTLASGGNRYSFQIGDGAVMDYAAFYNALVAGGFDSTDTTQLATPFVVALPGEVNLPDTGDVYFKFIATTNAFVLHNTSDDAPAGTLLATASLGGPDLVLLNGDISRHVTLSLADGDDIYRVELASFGNGKTRGSPLLVEIDDDDGSNFLQVMADTGKGISAVAFSQSGLTLTFAEPDGADAGITPDTIGSVLIEKPTQFTLVYKDETVNLGSIFSIDDLTTAMPDIVLDIS